MRHSSIGVMVTMACLAAATLSDMPLESKGALWGEGHKGGGRRTKKAMNKGRGAGAHGRSRMNRAIGMRKMEFPRRYAPYHTHGCACRKCYEKRRKGVRYVV